jgi:hypothetical protein
MDSGYVTQSAHGNPPLTGHGLGFQPGTVSSVPCPNCRVALPGNFCNTSAEVTCPACDHKVQVWVYPALFRERATGRKAELIVEAGVSSCFYHEGKKAVVPCDACGRFLCALCDVELNGRHICPSCLDKARTAPAQGGMLNLETTRTVYDGAALSLAVWPLLIWPATLLTAPAAVICGILAFFRPASLVGRSSGRAILAILLGLTQIGFWVWAFFFSE